MPPLPPQTEQIIFLIQKNQLILLCLFHFISSKPLWGSAPFIPVLWKIFILQIFSTAMATKCEKGGGALHLLSISAGAHLSVVASRPERLHPWQFQLCLALETRKIVHGSGFSNKSMKEPKNTDYTTENSK